MRSPNRNAHGQHWRSHSQNHNHPPTHRRYECGGIHPYARWERSTKGHKPAHQQRDDFIGQLERERAEHRREVEAMKAGYENEIARMKSDHSMERARWMAERKKMESVINGCKSAVGIGGGKSEEEEEWNPRPSAEFIDSLFQEERRTSWQKQRIAAAERAPQKDDKRALVEYHHKKRLALWNERTEL